MKYIKKFENLFSIKHHELQDYGKIIEDKLPSEGYYDFEVEYPYPLEWDNEPDHYIFMFFYDINTDEKVIEQVEKFFNDNNIKYEITYALHKNVSYLMAPWFTSAAAKKIQNDKRQIVFKIDINIGEINKELELIKNIEKYNL